jgi:hypothetical protein
MEFITRTAYGSFLQTCTLLGLQFITKPSTTLNQKFNIQAETLPNINDVPRLRYWGIGNGGHETVAGADATPLIKPVQHVATDAASFKHLPFVLREVSNDLTAAERNKYALRREEVHGTLRYFAYYLRRIDLTGVIPTMEYKTVVDGTVTAVPFVPDSSNLNPVPQQLTPEGVNLVDGDYVTASAKITLPLTKWDMDELKAVARIKFGSEDYAIISEVCLVTGVDKIVETTTTGNATINFNEVISAQVLTHLNEFVSAKFSNNGTEMILDVGATEPMFSLQSTSSAVV